MKKTCVIITAALALLIAASCAQYKRNNPYDPGGEAYAGITYKGSAWYPMSTEIKGMVVNQGFLNFAAYQTGPGDCVIKMTGAQAFTVIGSTGTATGSFNFINDIAADNSGNLYVTDKTAKVQVISAANTVTSWPISATGVDNLYLEWLNNYIFISNSMDDTVTKYTQSGVYDSQISITTTALGNFKPGRIFRSSSNLFVVNELDKSQVVKMTDTLINSDIKDFPASIYDGAAAITGMQLVSSRVVYKVDSNMVLSLKWGDFGEGPGRILNGKLAAYDGATNMTYILDSSTIKVFGE